MTVLQIYLLKKLGIAQKNICQAARLMVRMQQTVAARRDRFKRDFERKTKRPATARLHGGDRRPARWRALNQRLCPPWFQEAQWREIDYF